MREQHLQTQRFSSAGKYLAYLWCAVWAILFIAPETGARERGRVRLGGVYMYRFNLSADPKQDEERWQRILRTPEITVLCSQVSAPDPGEKVVRRVHEASAAGKRVILQLWWGGSGRYNWSRYSLAHIAMDRRIREDFFAEVIDPLIDRIGPEHIYGAHLLEETGMQFGVDLDVPGRPDDLTDGDDNGSNWDQPSWLGVGGVFGYIGGPYVPNIFRYNTAFRKETGLDMRRAPIWSYTGGWKVYREWVSARLEAGAMVAFAEHLHRKYPGMKAYTWDSVDWAGAGANNMRAMKGKIDGIIMDPYTDAAGIQAAVRAPRLIDPKVEIVAVLWGQEDKPEGEMLNRAAAAYAGGADTILFFGDRSFENQKTWQARVDQFRPFTRLPKFRSQPPVLFITGHGSWSRRLTGFPWHDTISILEAGPVPLKRYALVVLYAGADLPGLKRYIRHGGLVLTNRPIPFLIEKGLIREKLLSTYPRKEEIEYRPNAWWREQMQLSESYSLKFSRRVDYDSDVQGAEKDHALFVPYGKGAVCLLPCPISYGTAPQPQLESLQRLLADLARGLLLRSGQDQAAERAIYDPRIGPGYLQVPDVAGRATVYCTIGRSAFRPFPLQGENLLGIPNPVLGGNVRAAVMREASARP